MKTISGIEFASEHNGTDVFRVIELAYEQGWKDGHSEQLGTNLAEVGTDCISRQAAIDAVNSRKTAEQSSAGIMRNAVVDFCVDIIKKLPSAQPKTGKWILDRSGAYCCSECMEPCAGYVMMRPRDKYCKMCGSRNEVTP